MKKISLLATDLTLGALIAILSVLTAFTSWQFTSAEDTASGYNRDGMKMLTDANAEYLVVNQDIIQDYTYYDTYYLNYESNPEIAEYYLENFSPALTANLEREVIFDDAYYTEMYDTAQGMFDEADSLFEKAGQIGDRSNRLQVTSLVFAVALAFTAWASLLDKESKLRLVFALLAMLVLLGGIGVYLTAPGMPA
jgi:hypothetical protein